MGSGTEENGGSGWVRWPHSVPTVCLCTLAREGAAKEGAAWRMELLCWPGYTQAGGLWEEVSWAGRGDPSPPTSTLLPISRFH